jgi:hypothetical protein
MINEIRNSSPHMWARINLFSLVFIFFFVFHKQCHCWPPFISYPSLVFGSGSPVTHSVGRLANPKMNRTPSGLRRTYWESMCHVGPTYQRSIRRESYHWRSICRVGPNYQGSIHWLSPTRSGSKCHAGATYRGSIRHMRLNCYG